jgi:basic amino acid/polyamine antiporter, APA family
VAAKIFGPNGDLVITLLALLVVLASLNGNVFVTPRVIFGLAREGLGPRVLADVNAGGTPSEATLSVGIVAIALAVSGTFPQLLSLAIALVLMIDGVTVAALFPLRARRPEAPFRVPLYPFLPVLFIAVYVALLVGTALAQPGLVAIAAALLVAAWVLSWIPIGRESRSPSRE